MSVCFLLITVCVLSMKITVYRNKQKRYDQTCRHRGKYHEQIDVYRIRLPELGYLNLSNVVCVVSCFLIFA